MMVFQLAMKERITYGAEWAARAPDKKAPQVLGAMTTVHDGLVEMGKVYSFPLNFSGTPATLKLDFAKSGGSIVVGTQYSIGQNGEFGQTDRGASEPLGKGWTLTGQFTLTVNNTPTKYDTYKITITDPAAGKVKVEINSDIVVTTGVKEPATMGIQMTAMSSADFKGNVEVTVPQGGKAKIEMVDVLGNVMDSVQNLPAGTSNLHLKTPYKAGMYFIVLSGIEGVAPMMSKVIVQ